MSWKYKFRSRKKKRKINAKKNKMTEKQGRLKEPGERVVYKKGGSKRGGTRR